MNWMPWSRKEISLDTLLQRLEAVYASKSGVSVTPDNCMRSPTVHAIVTAVSRRISVSPVRVMKKTVVNGRERKEVVPSHPVARLLQQPNHWQTRTSYWLDATSTFMRHGKFYAFKARGSTGPIRRLMPLHPGAVNLEQDLDSMDVRVKVTETGGGQRDYSLSEMHYVRGAARDFLNGDSPVSDVKEAIALEIAAEEFGATFFGNGALPLLIFSLMQGFQGFKTKAEEEKFIEDFRAKFGGGGQHKAFMLPKGIEVNDPIANDNEKSQFLETRKYQRTVIAGAFGVPPHFVGDLERATFNNVEQQDTDFVINVVMPVAQAFESAMERDLLTDQDRRDGLIIRFNLDAVQRADFKSRQEGLQIQRQNGVIDADDWRERENLNPVGTQRGGNDLWRPSNFVVAGQEPEETDDGASSDDEGDDADDRAA